MSNSLRYRSNQVSSKRPTSPLQQQRSNDKDPSRKEKRRPRQPYLPIAGVIFIVFALLVVFSVFLTEEFSGIPHRSLRTILGFGILFEQDSIDYSKLPQCIDNYNDLPELWKPFKIIDANGKPKRLFMNENGEPQAKRPWTEQETLLATSALQKALYEILRYYHQEMTAAEVQDFQPDGINSLLDMTYGQEGLFHRTALKAARDQFVLVATPFMRFLPPIQNDSENEIHEEADKEYGDEDEKEPEDEDKYRQQNRHLDNQISEDAEERPNEYKHQSRRVDNKDSEDSEEDENEYMPKNRHLASKDSRYAEDSENDYSQQAKHLDDEDGQDASQEFDEEEQTRDEILKKEVSEDEEENDKDDLSEDTNKYETRRRLKKETDDTPNSRQYHRDSCKNQYMKMKLADTAIT